MLAERKRRLEKIPSTKEISETVDALACGLMIIGVSGNDLSIESQDKKPLFPATGPNGDNGPGRFKN